MREIKIDLPVCNQFDDNHDKQWAHRMCAICSLLMLLKLHNPELRISAEELLREGLLANAYLENVGWKHAGIVELASRHGLKLEFAPRFFYTPEEKEAGMAIINIDLKNNHPAIVSVFHHLNPAKGGHMVVVHGLQEFSGQTIGYYIQDPDASFRGHNYFLTKQEFIDGWRGGLIYQG
jgi:hypothetical protein